MKTLLFEHSQEVETEIGAMQWCVYPLLRTHASRILSIFEIRFKFMILKQPTDIVSWNERHR